MFADFPVLYVDAIVRRTLVSSIALGVGALAGGFLLGEALAGAGVVLGLGGATLNHRLFQVSTVRHIDSEGHLERRPYAGRSPLALAPSRRLPSACCSWRGQWVSG